MFRIKPVAANVALIRTARSTLNGGCSRFDLSMRFVSFRRANHRQTMERIWKRPFTSRWFLAVLTVLLAKRTENDANVNVNIAYAIPEFQYGGQQPLIEGVRLQSAS